MGLVSSAYQPAPFRSLTHDSLTDGNGLSSKLPIKSSLGFSLMFNFFHKRNERKRDKQYLEHLLGSMDYLLGFGHPAVINRILDKYPGIRSSVRNWRISERPASEISAEVLCLILTREIESLNTDRKQLILNELIEGKHPNSADAHTSMISMYWTQTQYMVHAGHLDAEARDLYINDLFGSVKGISSEDRQAARIDAYLGEAGLTSGWLCDEHIAEALMVSSETGPEGIVHSIHCMACGGKVLRIATDDQLKAFVEMYPGILTTKLSAN